MLALALCVAAASCAGRRERAAGPQAADPGSRRSVAEGALVGGAGRYGGQVWLGIPFAKPPVGPLRWRAPEPPETWPGTREALAFGSPCVQFASALGGAERAKVGTPTGSEDCLYLNVYA